MICCSGSRMLSAIRTPAVMMMPRKITAIDKHLAGDVGQRPVERLLRLLLALPHLGRQFIDGADGFGLAGVDRIAQQLGSACQLLR